MLRGGRRRSRLPRWAPCRWRLSTGSRTIPCRSLSTTRRNLARAGARLGCAGCRPGAARGSPPENGEVDAGGEKPPSNAGSRKEANALKHGFTGRLLGGLEYGLFADNPTDLQEFIQAVLAELAPVTAQERAEALKIVGLSVRRRRLVELEAMALAHATRTSMLPPGEPGGPPGMAEADLNAGRCDGHRR